MKSGCMEHIMREMIENELQPDNMDREEGCSLSKALTFVFQTAKQ
jgi:hypothetical protein